MGTAARTLVAVAISVAAAFDDARAETCTGLTATGQRFPICFDVGNRLSVTAGSDGVGGAISIRHVIKFEDEPDLEWKMEHVLGETTHAPVSDGLRAALYQGRFLRHARDGHILLPFGRRTRKVFLPFDIGAEVAAGTVTWLPGAPTTNLGVVRAAALIDVGRARTFRTRATFGPVGHWHLDMTRDPRTVVEHSVSPFSLAMFNLHFESSDGLAVLDLRVEGGSAWHTTRGWVPEARAEATLERTLIAVNDRPVALVLGVRHDTATEETIARVGARFVLVGARDARVSLLDHR